MDEAAKFIPEPAWVPVAEVAALVIALAQLALVVWIAADMLGRV